MANIVRVLFLSTILCLLTACGPSLNEKALSLQRAYTPPPLGSEKAPVVIIEYSSFTCSHCKDTYQSLHTMLREFPDLVQLHFKPVAFDPTAKEAAQSALAAALQGKFWQASDYLFSNQHRLAQNVYAELGTKVGLNPDIYSEDRNSSEIKNAVERNNSQFYALSMSGTPTVFINSTRYQGSRSLAKWREAIKAELKNLKIK